MSYIQHFISFAAVACIIKIYIFANMWCWCVWLITTTVLELNLLNALAYIATILNDFQKESYNEVADIDLRIFSCTSLSKKFKEFNKYFPSFLRFVFSGEYVPDILTPDNLLYSPDVQFACANSCRLVTITGMIALALFHKIHNFEYTYYY